MSSTDAERGAFARHILRGHRVEVRTVDGTTHEGVLAKADAEAWTIAYAWKKYDAGSDVRAQRGKPVESMTVKVSEISSVRARDVGMSDLAVGPSRMNDDFTDGGISRGATGANRELVAWTPETDDGSGAMTLEEEAATLGAKKSHGAGAWGKKSNGGAAWDQFAANKQLFGVDSKFDETVYTTSIDKSNAGISEAEAARIAYEIQNQISDNPHVAEERGQKATADYDEEERYSSVLGTGKAAAPPAPPSRPAWESGKVPSTVAQHAEKRAEKPAAHKADAAPADPSKSKLNPNAKAFSLSAKAAEFVPSFKKPAAPPAAPQMVMYPGYPQMPAHMMYQMHGMHGMMPGMMPGMSDMGAPGHPGAPHHRMPPSGGAGK